MYLLIFELLIDLPLLVLDTLLELVDVEHFYLFYKIYTVIIINNDEYYYSLKSTNKAISKKRDSSQGPGDATETNFQ
jgi:hypothetical protein